MIIFIGNNQIYQNSWGRILILDSVHLGESLNYNQRVFFINYLLFLDANGLRDYILLHAGYYIIPSDYHNYQAVIGNQEKTSIPKKTNSLLFGNYNQDIDVFVSFLKLFSNLEYLTFSAYCFTKQNTKVEFRGNERDDL